MTSRGVLFVTEHIEDQIKDELKEYEHLDTDESDENWMTEIEKEYPPESVVPIVRYREEEGEEIKEKTGLVEIELKSVIKEDYINGEYVGKEVKRLNVKRPDSYPERIY